MTMIRVIAAVVDTKRLQLYKEDGKTIEILQGDPRLAPIVAAAEPLANPVAFKLPKNANGSYYLDIDVPDRTPEKDNSIADYEKKVGGITKFFRVAKAKLVSFFHSEEAPVEPQTLGEVPVISNTSVTQLLPKGVTNAGQGITTGGGNVEKPFEIERPPVEIKGATMSPAPETEPVKEDDSRKDPKISSAIADIMANAEPVSDPEFNVDDTKPDETIIAVVDDGTGNVGIVPDVQNLKNHMVAAAKSGNTKGMQAFMSRLAAMGKKRNHTVEELLRFMERGDLPLADDGTIIAYKVLRSTKKDGSKLTPGTYVDCHTGKVEQRVGSYVCQSEQLIDGSRTECSTGLHIARRGYLGGFSGDIITMVKVKPEDVVSVPGYDANKMRAAGYHIIGLVPRDEHVRLRSNQQMQGTNALKMLTMAIEGDHIDVIEIVEITSPSGGSFTITPVEGAHGKRPQMKKETVVTVPVAEVPKVEPLPMDAEPVDPKAAAKKVSEVKKLTVSEYARELYRDGKIEELKAYKKKAKKGWDKLGFTPEEEALILGSGDSPVTNGQPIGQIKPLEVPASALKEPKPTPATKVDVRTDKTPKPKKEAPVAETTSLTGTRAEVARTLFDQAAAGDKSRWGTLWRHQKECKKSWKVLGFSDKEIERIKNNKPDWV